MQDIRRGMWLIAIGITLFCVAQSFAGEPVKLNVKGFKEGCVCTGESYQGGARYEKVLVVAMTPQGSDYWVFYTETQDMLETRHRRSDGTLMALMLPVERFLEKNKFRPGKAGRLKCPDTYWSAGGQTADASQ